ncbi:MAG: sugar ABC transporter ATP-binding protein [Spirochaetales bacterium]|uniref:Sugar ABC transporter ATP-binding protein n=1 Tax=Candidatus Thalassospirochaeta sargassi TaxID=3119039 RepID=A0AAJ1MIR7_9SPIO|nr:sugar ABC transporter ATP-binding protein [Spirochaetales bacterium]
MKQNFDEIIRMENISKEFPGVKALTDVSISINAGEVHAIVGENGAGKSTLIKVMMGVYQKNAGDIYISGKKVDIRNPIDAQNYGLSAVYQDVTIARHLTVAENFFLGKPPLTKAGFVNWKKMNNQAQDVLDELNLDIDAKSPVKQLSVAQQEMVIIAKKYFEHSKIIIFDEPTALLANEEVEELFSIIRRLKNEGVACIYISHRMEEIFELCDRVSVMKDGCLIDTMMVADTNEDDLISKMVGRTIEDMYSIEHCKAGDEAMRVEGLTRDGYFEDINFSIHQGEVFGIFGLVGSGRTEIVRAIFGADKFDSGEIYLYDNKVKISDPSSAIRKGIGLLPEDRKHEGLTLETTVENNINMASYKDISKLGFINLKKEKERSLKQIEDMKIKTPSEKQRVINLSGGNQQKVVIGKWLCCDSNIFIFDEPTVGIDVGAKSEIYRLLEQLLSEGNAIIMISSYLPEIIGIADRIMVIHEGKQTGIVERGDYSEEKLLKLASGL